MFLSLDYVLRVHFRVLEMFLSRTAESEDETNTVAKNFKDGGRKSIIPYSDSLLYRTASVKRHYKSKHKSMSLKTENSKNKLYLARWVQTILRPVPS